MKKIIAILLIAAIACSIDDPSEEVRNKTQEIEEKARELAEEIVEKARKMAEEMAQKAQEKGDASAQKAQELAEEIEANSKELVKDFLKYFEKLSDEVKMAVIYLQENGYLEKLISLAEMFGKGSASRLCQTFFSESQDCDKVVQFIYDNIIGLYNKAQNVEELQ